MSSLPPQLAGRFRVTDSYWLWNDPPGTEGYAQVHYNGRSRHVHRLMYELLVGAVPEGLVLDHLCRERTCVRPDHLEPVTNRENILRGVSPSARNAVKTHCVHGHEFTQENTYAYTRLGKRECRTCKRIRARHRRARVAAARAILREPGPEGGTG